MPVSITITVADLPPMPEGAELYRFTVGMAGRPCDLKSAVQWWLDSGTGFELGAQATKPDGDGELEYETAWDKDKGEWSPWIAS